MNSPSTANPGGSPARIRSVLTGINTAELQPAVILLHGLVLPSGELARSAACWPPSWASPPWPITVASVVAAAKALRYNGSSRCRPRKASGAECDATDGPRPVEGR